MGKLGVRLLLVSAVVIGLLVPAQAALAFSDVPTSYWDYDAITYMATTHDWMLDYSSTKFKPTTTEKRRHLARTLVRIYAPNEPIDPSITFPDLPNTDPYFPYANVAVKLGWIPVQDGGIFNSDGEVTVSLMDMALVLATGDFTSPLAGLSNIHMSDGTKFTEGSRWPYWQLARWLGLHYNHDDESKDIQASSRITRDEAAYSMWTMLTLDSWQISGAGIFDDVELPVTTGDTKDLTQFALDQVGYPYIWGGEWNAASPPGYCCGAQPQAGMDCSGFVWFVMKKNESNYNAAKFHPNYSGWTLAERTSSTMAQMAPKEIAFKDLLPGDLIFTAGNGGSNWTDVDHVGIYLGNDWMMHSTSGGPQLQNIADGYYYDNFVWGRDLMGSIKGAPSGTPTQELLAGDPAVGPAFNGSR